MYQVESQLLLKMMQNHCKIEELTHLRQVIWIKKNVLRDMELLSKIIFLFHDIGQTFVRNVEEIDERLYVSTLQ